MSDRGGEGVVDAIIHTVVKVGVIVETIVHSLYLVIIFIIS